VTEIFSNLGAGFVSALEPLNVAMILLGLAIGIVAGALPGITMLNTIVLVLPFTYVMGIVPALLLMIGIYCGGVFGGSITAILFNIPGDPMNVPTAWEGYPLARQGRTRYALGLAIMASAFGGVVSALFLTFFAPPFARFALGFSTVEFFAVVIFGLASVSVLGQASMPAALISLFAGVLLGTVGTEPQYGVERFAFGVPFLKTGVDFVTVLIGLFAIGEVLEQVVLRRAGPPPESPRARAVPRLPLLDLWPLRWPLVRGTSVGIAVGGLAGAGATVSSFVAYGLEKQASGTPQLFGRGHAGGLVAAESANNGSTGGAMIHLLTLGIPGSAATAVMMGAFLIHGIQPGPLLFTRHPAAVYTIFAGMILANVIMIALGFLAALSFALLMRVPAPILNTFIVVLCFLGAFALRNDMADVWLTMLFGIAGFFMRRYDLPIPPLVMGIILGPMAEQYFLTSMVSHGNDPMVFVTRPVSAVVLALAGALVLWPFVRAAGGRRVTPQSPRAPADRGRSPSAPGRRCRRRRRARPPTG
jgi:putative tricarboxylic transport membrane protein